MTISVFLIITKRFYFHYEIYFYNYNVKYKPCRHQALKNKKSKVFRL